MQEPPYGAIWDLLKDGSVVPFLGAGASLMGRPAAQTWDGDHPAVLPSGVELAGYLAAKSEFPSKDRRDLEDLAKVSSYFSDLVGRRRLRQRLHDILNHDFQFGALHQLLAAIPANLLIVATNYDTLVEQAFQAADKPYDLVIYPNDQKDLAGSVLWWPHGAEQPRGVEPNLLDIDLAKKTVIYKMHGSVVRQAAQWDNFVITEEDYVEFLSRMSEAVPRIFYSYCESRSFLFLGYSLRDWNLRVVLRNLSRTLARRGDEELPSWAIQRGPSELEIALWRKRNVEIFDVPLDEFTARIRQEGRI
ncbi:MAG: hypothetical protein C5B51_21835 [Terriglobia bacterium]|nr:MAG: hypothetical protein C5B51_21835 [Terriglobia bacterium]